MRSFRQIIDDANGPAALAHRIGVAPDTAKQWKRNDSIPAPYFEAIRAAQLATLEELAVAAAARRGVP